MVPQQRPRDRLRLRSGSATDLAALSDNLGSHKSAVLRSLIKAAGARLWYLPPYSPGLNPIDQTLAKVKHWMRSPQKLTIDDICRHIGGLVSTIQPNECSNYFQNSG